MGVKTSVRKRKKSLALVSRSNIATVGFIVPVYVHPSRVAVPGGIFKKCLKPRVIESIAILGVPFEKDSPKIVLGHGSYLEPKHKQFNLGAGPIDSKRRK